MAPSTSSTSLPHTPTARGATSTCPAAGDLPGSSSSDRSPFPAVTSARAITSSGGRRRAGAVAVLCRLGGVGLVGGWCPGWSAEQGGSLVGERAHEGPELGEASGRHILLQPGDADRTHALPRPPGKGCPDAEHAEHLFLVVEGKPAAADSGQLAEQLGDVGDRARRMAEHPRLGADRPHPLLAVGGEDGLAGGGGIGGLAPPERGGEADQARTVDTADTDRVAVLGESEAGREPAGFTGALEQIEADLAERV